jgi:hypothetical protein
MRSASALTSRSPSLASGVALRLTERMAGRVASAALKQLDDAALSALGGSVASQVREALNLRASSSGDKTSQTDLPATKTRV